MGANIEEKKGFADFMLVTKIKEKLALSAIPTNLCPSSLGAKADIARIHQFIAIGAPMSVGVVNITTYPILIIKLAVFITTAWLIVFSTGDVFGEFLSFHNLPRLSTVFIMFQGLFQNNNFQNFPPRLSTVLDNCLQK